MSLKRKSEVLLQKVRETSLPLILPLLHLIQSIHVWRQLPLPEALPSLGSVDRICGKSGLSGSSHLLLCAEY